MIFADFAFRSSQSFIAGERPSLRGPNPKGNVRLNSGDEGIGTQSKVANSTSSPCDIRDSQSLKTEYDGPLASIAISGTI